MVAKERIVKERREKRQEDGKTAVLYKAGKKASWAAFSRSQPSSLHF
jgi:hypothetical protein